jgi:MFS family permease
MSASSPDRMSSEERRAGISLAAVFALRMLGLFLILPVFSLYAKELPSGNDVALVGMALGAYGLTQACLQIAYGAASDRFGRKPVIVFGLLLFVAGSFVAALPTTSTSSSPVACCRVPAPFRRRSRRSLPISRANSISPR